MLEIRSPHGGGMWSSDCMSVTSWLTRLRVDLTKTWTKVVLATELANEPTLSLESDTGQRLSPAAVKFLDLCSLEANGRREYLVPSPSTVSFGGATALATLKIGSNGRSVALDLV